MLEFFAEESNEYLEKLQRTLTRDEGPDTDEMRRLARALRGSARLVDQDSIARAAGAIQGVAEDLGAGRRHWDEELQNALGWALEEIREMVASLASPASDFAARADAIEARLGETHKPLPPPREDDRFRRYLGTELRGLATEIGDALGILERDPRNREPLKRLLRRVRPLRGIEGVDELPAVGSAVAAIEEVILRIADTSATVGPGHLVLFRRARQALDDVATDLIRGEPLALTVPGGTEIEDLKDQILESGAQPDVTWISELFTEQAGPHVEKCPMADRGAGSWEAFFVLEATGSLDTIERLRGEIARDADSANRIGGRLAYTFRQLRERAVTFGHPELGRLARRAGSAVRAALGGPPWRVQAISASFADIVESLREYLQASGEEERTASLSRAEALLNAATDASMTPAVPIESLLYGPEEALARARTLWDEADDMLRDDQPDVGRAHLLLHEAMGLVEHALSLTSRPR